MIPSHSAFLRELFQSGGKKVTRQKKTGDRTRELRKKARRPSGQCKDGRARIKRTSIRETLPETVEGPRAGHPDHAGHASGHRGPSSRALPAQRRERGQLKARPGLARRRTRYWKKLQARCPPQAPLPRHLRAAPSLIDGTAAKFLGRASFRATQLACAEVRRGARISAPLDSCPTSSSIPLIGKRERPLTSARLLKTVPVTLGDRGGNTRRGLFRARPREPVEVKARSRELQRPTPSTSPAISLPSSPDVTPSPAAVKRPRRRWLPSMQEEGSRSRFQPPPPRVSGASKWRLAF